MKAECTVLSGLHCFPRHAGDRAGPGRDLRARTSAPASIQCLASRVCTSESPPTLFISPPSQGLRPATLHSSSATVSSSGHFRECCALTAANLPQTPKPSSDPTKGLILPQYASLRPKSHMHVASSHGHCHGAGHRACHPHHINQTGAHRK